MDSGIAGAERVLDWTVIVAYLTLWLFNQKVYYCMAPDRLSTTFAALADPTRRAILARLASGEASVMELAAPFAMSLPAISKHLKVLERAGLIARGRAAQWRPCCLEAGPLKDAADWLEEYRRFWEQSFDRLDDYLRALQKKEKQHGRKK
jgi:DNA-binding transcriptional ArsR family regulator